MIIHGQDRRKTKAGWSPEPWKDFYGEYESVKDFHEKMKFYERKDIEARFVKIVSG